MVTGSPILLYTGHPCSVPSQVFAHSNSPSVTERLAATLEEGLDTRDADAAPAFAPDVTGRR